MKAQFKTKGLSQDQGTMSVNKIDTIFSNQDS